MVRTSHGKSQQFKSEIDFFEIDTNTTNITYTMKTKLMLAVFLAASSSSIFAASISVNLFTDTAAVTSTGTLLGSTYQARIGRYTGAALTATSTAADILTGWTQAGVVNFQTGPAALYAGYFDGQANFTNALGLAGTPVFVWFTDGGNNNAVITGLGVSFLSDSAIPNSNSLSIDANVANSSTYLLGSRNEAGVSPFGGGTIVLNQAAVIPEPSAALLGAIGVLGLLRRRRN